MSPKVRRKAVSVLMTGGMALFSVVGLWPLVWMLYSSVKSEREFAVSVLAPPTEIHLENFLIAFQRGKMATYFLNSFFNASVTVVLVAVIAFSTAYVLARIRFRGRNFLYGFFISGMLIPIYALLIPIFIQYRWIGLINTRITLILPYIAFGLPIAIFLIESFIKSVPSEIEEAAYMEGANMGRTMFNIILPVCSPVIATIFILTFLNAWNEFPLALVLVSSDRFKTIPVGLTIFYGEYSVQYPLLLAALFLASLPVLAVYLIFHGRIVEGMTAGAVKG